MKLNAQMMAALRTFDAAARCGSFTQAGKELHISAAAISQQMANLESQLKLVLFERHSRGIRLTTAGRTLFNVVQPSLISITTSIENLQHGAATDNEIRVKSTPSFAYKWLVPRLQDFYRTHPDIRVQIFADGALVDKDKTDYDLAIDFAPIPYPDPGSATSYELLMTETLIPVVSPNYAAQHDWQDPQCWDKVNLLHDAMPWHGASSDSEWRFWFDVMGLVNQKSLRGHSFNRTDLAMEAASAGQGVALARRALLGEDINKGVLVAPFAPINADCGYYLLQGVAPRSDCPTDRVELFKTWLRQQASDWELTHTVI